MQGVYFYGDYCTGRIWGLTRDGWRLADRSSCSTPTSRSRSFGEDEAGELYVADLDGGAVYQVVDEGGCAGVPGDPVPTAGRYRLILPIVARGECR